MTKCIVCESGLIESFYTSDKKKHWKCNTCAAKFLDTIHYVDEETEKGRYLEHKNIIDDPEKVHIPLPECGSVLPR
jgi:hypothetical protein